MRYHHVDVFTNEKFGGNQLAVFPDARGLNPEQMQAIAREMAFSESSFIFPPQDPSNDYRIRIFTPSKELPMAGHPTIGTAFVLHYTRTFTGDSLRFEEGVGLVPVSIKGDKNNPRITMQQPLPSFGPRFDDRAAIAAMLGLAEGDLPQSYPVQVVTCGVPVLIVPVQDIDTLRRIKAPSGLIRATLGSSWPEEVYVFAPRALHPGHTARARMFAPDLGILEDPATGAAAGPLGAYLVEYAIAAPNTPLVIEQGYEMGRPSQLHVQIVADNTGIQAVAVGGHAVYMGAGALEI